LIPSIPPAPSSTPVTTREAHFAKKCLQMRLPISPLYLNSLKHNRLKLDDYEFHSRTDASPRPPAPGPWPPGPRPPAPGPWPLARTVLSGNLGIYVG